MKKKKLNIKFILVIVILIVITVYLYKRYYGSVSDTEIEDQIANPKPTSTVSATTPTTQKRSTSTTLGNDAILKNGTWGREVGWVQYYYNKMIATPKKLPKLKQDNKFGSNTEKAVISILGRNYTSWTEWKRTLDAKTTSTFVPPTYSYNIPVPIAESTAVVNPFALKL